MLLQRARGQAAGVATPGVARRRAPGLGLRLRVWSGSLQLDRRLAEGVAPANSPELSLRARQLVGERSRRALAGSLTSAVLTAWRPPVPWAPAAPIAGRGVREAAPRLDALARDLTTSGEHAVRGVALVSFLVCDPGSPLYNRDSPVSVAEIADRARSALNRG
jgi:hypothetical protein